MPIHTYPLPAESESGGGSASRIYLPARSAAVFPSVTDCRRLFNGTLCGHDVPYFQPVVSVFQAPEPCSDAVLTFRARIDNVFTGGNGTFAFFSTDDACPLNVGTFFLMGDRTPSEFAQFYAEWVNEQDIAGITATANGNEITLFIPKDATPCGCNLRLSYLPLVADVSILQQPQCCTPQSSDCDLPEGFAEMVFSIAEPVGFSFGNLGQDFAFRLQFAEYNCLDIDFSLFDARLRTALSADYSQYLMRVLHGLQHFVMMYGRSVVRLAASTGTFTILWDQAYFLSQGINICGKEWTVCTFQNGEQSLNVTIEQQPRCCNPLPKKCTIPDGFAEFIFELPDNPAYQFGNPDNDVLFTLDYVYTGCIGNFAMSEADLRLSNSTDFADYLPKVEAVFRSYFENYGNSTVSRTGNRYTFLLDKAYYADRNIDICNENLMICQFHPDGQEGLGQWIQVEIVQQPTCCPPVDPCPPPAIAKDEIDFIFNLPDEFNDFSDPEAVKYGWSFENENALIEVTLTDGSCNALEIDVAIRDMVVASWVGASEDGSRYQYVRWDTSRISADCFGFHFRHRTPCGWVDYYSEPFRREDCGNTLLIDTDGGHCSLLNEAPEEVISTYAPPLNRYRIRGVLERVGYATERETLNGRLLRLTQIEEWTLRSEKLPEYVVLRVADLFTHQNIRINGIAFDQIGEIRRNASTGRMWHLEISLKRTVCEQNGNCA